MIKHWIDSLPIWGMLVPSILFILVSIQVGLRLGSNMLKRNGELNDAPIGSVVGASLGLLAFMLAFTFQLTTNRFDSRKELLLSEVDNIRDSYLRASLLKEPQSSETKKLLREYVDMRVTLVDESPNLALIIKRSEEIHHLLWKQAEALAEIDRSSEIYALFTSSLNEVINTHTKRVTIGLHYRIPAPIFWVLYIISFFSMGVLGYQFGISGKNNFVIHVVVALIFSVVLWLILSLDRPEKSILKVNQQPMLKLQQQMHEK